MAVGLLRWQAGLGLVPQQSDQLGNTPKPSVPAVLLPKPSHEPSALDIRVAEWERVAREKERERAETKIAEEMSTAAPEQEPGSVRTHTHRSISLETTHSLLAESVTAS
jgi:hypothetical protein